MTCQPLGQKNYVTKHFILRGKTARIKKLHHHKFYEVKLHTLCSFIKMIMKDNQLFRICMYLLADFPVETYLQSYLDHDT